MGKNNSTNTISYSSDGITWTGLGTTIFSTYCRCFTYGNSLYIAGGSGSGNTVAYSSNGTQWTGLGTTIF
jgi:hypothetical protein